MSNWFKKFSNAIHIGYKIVSWNGVEAFSLYDRNKKVNINIGAIDSSIYLGTSKDFCLDYYSGLTDDRDILLIYSYHESDIVSGNSSSNGEVLVRKAQLKNVEFL